MALVLAGLELVFSTEDVLVCDVLVDLACGFLCSFDELVLLDVSVLDLNLLTWTFLLLERTYRLNNGRLATIDIRSPIRQSLMRTALHC